MKNKSLTDKDIFSLLEDFKEKYKKDIEYYLQRIEQKNIIKKTLGEEVKLNIISLQEAIQYLDETTDAHIYIEGIDDSLVSLQRIYSIWKHNDFIYYINSKGNKRLVLPQHKFYIREIIK